LVEEEDGYWLGEENWQTINNMSRLATTLHLRMAACSATAPTKKRGRRSRMIQRRG